ncbi:hypothetical protein OXX80_013748 [Metschnikowia pulcherrima]
MSFQELLNPKVLTPLTGEIRSPPGFDHEISKTKKTDKKENLKKPSQKELDSLKVKKAWEVATMPAKNIPMNLIMSYMTGNSLQVIPIIMTLIVSGGKHVDRFMELNKMGLIPNKEADWLSWQVAGEYIEKLSF